MVLKLLPENHQKGLLKHSLWGASAPRVSHSVGFGWDVIRHSSNNAPGDADASGLGITPWRELLQDARITELDVVLSPSSSSEVAQHLFCYLNYQELPEPGTGARGLSDTYAWDESSGVSGY